MNSSMPVIDDTPAVDGDYFRSRALQIRSTFKDDLQQVVARGTSARRTTRAPGQVSESIARDIRGKLDALFKDHSLDRSVYYRSNFDLTEGEHYFHFRVFIECTGAQTNGLSYIMTPGDLRPWLAFGSQEDLDAFDAWITAYEKHFDVPIAGEKLPRWPNTPRTATVINVPPRINEDKLYFNIMAWYLLSCTGRMWFDGKYFFFENPDDGVSFRMRWT